MQGVGGGVTHTRSVIALLRRIPELEVEVLTLPLPWSAMPRALRQARATLRGLASRVPGKTHYLLDAHGRASVRMTLRRRPPDLAILNGADLLPLLDLIPPAAGRVLLSHNVEAEVLRWQIDGAGTPRWLRRLLQPEVGKIRGMEEAGAREVDLILAISAANARWYRERAPDCAVEVLATPFPEPPYQGPRLAPLRPLKLAYVAKMSWAPNRAGAERLLAEVMPALPARAAEFHFYGPGTEAFAGRHPALRGHGVVDSLDEVWRNTHFTLCPVESGFGLHLKLVESLYNGMPSLSSTEAAAALGTMAGPAVMALPLADWAGFLASERADALAAATVPPELVDAFSAASHIDRMSRLLSQAARR
jgi:hypothetical protein